jgi:hypothetical protein
VDLLGRNMYVRVYVCTYMHTYMHTSRELVVVSEHAARNMAYQMLSPAFGKVEQLCRVSGVELLGLRVAAPLSQVCVCVCVCVCVFVTPRVGG